MEDVGCNIYHRQPIKSRSWQRKYNFQNFTGTNRWRSGHVLLYSVEYLEWCCWCLILCFRWHKDNVIWLVGSSSLKRLIKIDTTLLIFDHSKIFHENFANSCGDIWTAVWIGSEVLHKNHFMFNLLIDFSATKHRWKFSLKLPNERLNINKSSHSHRWNICCWN